MIRYGRLAVLVAVYLLIAYLIPPPATITTQGWRWFAIFMAVIGGQILQPLPSAAIVILGLAAMVANGMPWMSTANEPAPKHPNESVSNQSARVRSASCRVYELSRSSVILSWSACEVPAPSWRWPSGSWP